MRLFTLHATRLTESLYRLANLTSRMKSRALLLLWGRVVAICSLYEDFKRARRMTSPLPLPCVHLRCPCLHLRCPCFLRFALRANQSMHHQIMQNMHRQQAQLLLMQQQQAQQLAAGGLAHDQQRQQQYQLVIIGGACRCTALEQPAAAASPSGMGSRFSPPIVLFGASGGLCRCSPRICGAAPGCGWSARVSIPHDVAVGGAATAAAAAAAAAAATCQDLVLLPPGEHVGLGRASSRVFHVPCRVGSRQFTLCCKICLCCFRVRSGQRTPQGRCLRHTSISVRPLPPQPVWPSRHQHYYFAHPNLQALGAAGGGGGTAWGLSLQQQQQQQQAFSAAAASAANAAAAAVAATAADTKSDATTISTTTPATSTAAASPAATAPSTGPSGGGTDTTAGKAFFLCILFHHRRHVRTILSTFSMC